MAATSLNVPELVQVAVQFGLPVLVGLVTKSSTPAKYKSLLLVALTGLNAALSGTSTEADLTTVLTSALFGIVVSVGVHKGVLEPTGVAAWAQATLVKDKPAEKAAEQHDAERLGPVEAAEEKPLEEDLPPEDVCLVRHKEGSAAQLRCKKVHQ